ncbi:MAG: Na+/H+ antiporter subunit E [Pseudomonadota bacterium]
MRTIFTTLTLFALWLLMSGVYKPLVIALGLASAILAVYVEKRMNFIDNNPLNLDVSLYRMFRYFAWLHVEIAKSNWAVTKLILSPNIKLRQNLFEVPFTQKSEFCEAMFANSITLTPGTITVEVEPDHFLVHALAYTDEHDEALADMDRRVTEIESGAAQ